MLHRPTPRAWLAGVIFLSMATIPGPAPADTFFETVYLPTSSVVGLPTSSVMATSYVVPTAYATSYIPTSSVVTTGDYAVSTSTVARRSRLRPRRYVERTSYMVMPTTYVAPTSYFLPTSYVVPTGYVSSSSVVMPTGYVSSSFITPTSYVIDGGVIATSASSYPCETTSSPSTTKSTASKPPAGGTGDGDAIISKPSSVAPSGERRPSAMMNTTPGDDDRIPSNVSPPVPANVAPPAPVPANNRPVAGESGTPPAAPLAEPDPLKMPPPGTSGQLPPNETTLRGARRPVYDARNILRGRVISADSRQPEEGVSVVISSLTKNFSDRNAMTNAYGEFNVSLPDGDWAVKVKMPSGAIYPVGRDFVTASSGRVTDSAGRNVAEFLITR